MLLEVLVELRSTDKKSELDGECGFEAPDWQVDKEFSWWNAAAHLPHWDVLDPKSIDRSGLDK